MNPTLQLILRILGLTISGIGIIIVYLAPKIVDHYGLAEKKQLDPRLLEALDSQQQTKYRRDAAILDVKLRGLLVASPGFALILVAFH